MVSEFLRRGVQGDSELRRSHDIIADSDIYVGVCQLGGYNINCFGRHIGKLSNLFVYNLHEFLAAHTKPAL